MKKQHFIDFQQLFFGFFGFIILLSILSNPAFAQDANTIAVNMIASTYKLPGLITGIAYLIGTAFAAYGVIKTKEHVENPNQTALRYPIASFLIGGSMFALPVIYESMANLINGGTPVTGFAGGADNAATGGAGGVVAGVTGAVGGAVNALTGGAANMPQFSTILSNITASVSTTPGLITGVAYLLGLLMGIAGLLKLKEHIEEPSRAAMKDGIVRLVVGGMLFSIPTMYTAMLALIEGSAGGGTGVAGVAGAIGAAVGGLGGGVLGGAAGAGSMAGTAGGLTSEAGGGGCGGNAIGNIAAALGGGGGFGLGSVVCNLFISTAPMAMFLQAMAYLFGLVVGIWGILRIKEHVENPAQVTIWDPVAKIVTAGGFFALPLVVTVAYNTVATGIADHSNQLNGTVRGAGGGGPAGLDGMIGALVNDTFMPMSVIINWFGLVAGFIFVFIGVSRLMKSAQEGARGPGGIGTIMTFVTGGALLAFSPMVTSISTSLFAADGLSTPNEGTLRYTTGMDPAAIARAETVLDAIILFVMMLGLISIMRGIFIVRGVSEGNSQASMMAGMTHLIGGGIAVNLAPMLNAVQNTLGIPALNLGIQFGGGAGGAAGGIAGAIGNALGIP